MARDNGRAFVQYVEGGDGEISLPGYLDARPSIVSPGDVFSIREEYEDEILRSDRFAAADVVDESPNASRTKAALAKELGVDAGDYSKDDLVTLADDRAKMYPPVPGATGDNAPDYPETPIPGQDVDDVTDAGDDTTTTPEGDAQ